MVEFIITRKYFCMRFASGRLRPAETGAKMRATGGWRQPTADGLRKRSPTGTRREAGRRYSNQAPGFAVCGAVRRPENSPAPRQLQQSARAKNIPRGQQFRI